MERRFRNSFGLLILLLSLAVKSIAGSPAPERTASYGDSTEPSHLSACSHLSNSEAEESSSINEVDLCYKLPFAEAVFFNANLSIDPPKVLCLVRKKGISNVISPFYRYILYPFHAFW